MSAFYILGLVIGEAILLSGLASWMQAPARPAARTGAPGTPADPSEGEPVRYLTDGMTGLQRQLAQAGFTSPSAQPLFTASKFLSGLIAASVAFALSDYWPDFGQDRSMVSLGLCIAIFAIGYMLPARWIARRQQAYKRRIERALPDAMDMLQICLESGQSLDQALIRVSRQLAGVHPELAAHLGWAAESVLVGMDRGEALARIATETENEDFATFGATLVQAARMGTPVAQTLAVYTNDLRDKTLRKVEAKANILPTKMTLGTMMFTVPPLLILLLTPAAIRLMSTI